MTDTDDLAQEMVWTALYDKISDNKIIDGLQREHLPPEFQKVRFEGSRPGTGYD